MARKAKLAHVVSGRRGDRPVASPRMVDVGHKPVTPRQAKAEAWVTLAPSVASLLRRMGGLQKGSVLETARLAAIMAAKQTPALIPMCHPIPIDAVEVTAGVAGPRVRLEVTVRAEARTGVEMEAMTAAAVAALTVYDMVKSAGKEAQIGPIRLLAKSGGKSGTWTRGGPAHAAS